MRRLLALPLAFVLSPLSLAATACDDGAPGEGEGEGSGEGEGEGAGDVFAVLGTTVIDEGDPLVVPGFAVTARRDGRFAVAWFERASTTVTCTLFGGGTVEGDQFVLKLADEQPDGGVRVRVVDEVPNTKEDAVDLAVDVDDNVLVAYQGGDVTDNNCGATDLMLAVENGDGFDITTVAAVADTGAPCRDIEDPLCAQGSVVGLYPGLSVRGDDVAISYLDTHFGFGDTDINSSDLELAHGTAPQPTLSSVNVESGGGYHSTATLLDDGGVLVGHNVVANNVFSDGDGGTFVVEDGIYAEVVDDAGVVTSSVAVLPGVQTASRVATAARAGQGLFLAVHNRSDEQLLLYRSIDNGAQWTPSPVEQLGRTGRDPGLVFLDDGRLVVAYGHCRDDQNQDGCSARDDGVRLALQKDDGRFTKVTLDGDAEDLEGVGVDVARSGPSELVVVSLNSSQNRLIVHRVQVN